MCVETFKRAVLIACAMGAVVTVLCLFADEAMIRFFSSDPAVIAVGAEYLRIIAWGTLASGIVFVNGSMFQAMGNTIAAADRLVHAHPGRRDPCDFVVSGVGLRASLGLVSLSRRDIAASGMNLMLLRREFRIRLAF